MRSEVSTSEGELTLGSWLSCCMTDAEPSISSCLLLSVVRHDLVSSASSSAKLGALLMHWSTELKKQRFFPPFFRPGGTGGWEAWDLLMALHTRFPRSSRLSRTVEVCCLESEEGGITDETILSGEVCEWRARRRNAPVGPSAELVGTGRLWAEEDARRWGR